MPFLRSDDHVLDLRYNTWSPSCALAGEVVLTVPALITLAETETGTPVSTDLLRPGLRVTVLGLPASPLLRTPAAFRSVGPEAFGDDFSSVPLR